MVKLGTNLPEHLIGTDHGALAEFLSGIEELGYGYITIGDHVLGADLECATRLEAVPRQGAALRPAHAVARPARAVRLPHRADHHARDEHRHPGRAAAAGRAARQAGRRGRHPLRRTAAPRDRRRLERRRVRGDRGELRRPRQDHGRAGRADASALDSGGRRLLGQVPHRHRRRHQPAAGATPDPAVVRWAVAGRAEAAGRLADGWFPWYTSFDPVKLAEDLAVIHESALCCGSRRARDRHRGRGLLLRRTLRDVTDRADARRPRSTSASSTRAGGRTSARPGTG